MKCHICDNELEHIYRTNKLLPCGHMECRSPECPRKSIIDRCCVSYEGTKVTNYSFWFFGEDKVWYHIKHANSRVTAVRYKVEIIGIGKYGNKRYELKAEPAKILEEKDFKFNISIDDNLVEKADRLLKRIKNLVIFS